jgi:1,4-alpha-glucan branching enzyme
MINVGEGWVEFEFFRPGANSVSLAGDFNDWHVGNLEMIPLGGGLWRARVQLPPGEYRFRYCADGEWFPDYAACGLEPGRFGMDSIVRVPRRSIAVTPAAQIDSESQEEGIYAA